MKGTSLDEWKLILEAQSATDMEPRLSQLGPEFLSRGQGVRTNEAVELCVIRKYLCLKMRIAEIGYPLALYSKDRPDFRLEEAGIVTGVEVTTATFKRTQIALQQAHELGLGIFSLGGLAREDAKVPDRADAIRNYLQNEEVNSPGYSGCEVEIEALRLLDAAVDAKLAALNKVGFQRFKLNQLLIYENSGLPPLHWEDVNFEQLQQKNISFQGIKFDHITVVSDIRIIEIV